MVAKKKHDEGPPEYHDRRRDEYGPVVTSPQNPFRATTVAATMTTIEATNPCRTAVPDKPETQTDEQHDTDGDHC